MSPTTSKRNPIFEECQATRTKLGVFRVVYLIVALVAFLCIWSNAATVPSGVFVTFLILLFGAIVLDISLSQSVNQRENTERERQRTFAEKASQEKQKKQQEAVMAEWVERCKAAGGLIQIESSFPCKRGEGVVYTENGVRLQETRKVRGPGGTSTDQWKTLDTGTMHVTNQRLVFIGDNGTRNVAFKDIIATKCYLDSFDVTSSKRAKPMGFLCKAPRLILAIVKVLQENPETRLVPASSIPDSCYKGISSSSGDGIDGQYLEMVQDAADEIGRYLRELEADPATDTLLARVDGLGVLEGQGLFSTNNPSLGFLVFTDLIRTSKGLGCSLEAADEAEFVGIACGLSQVVQIGDGTQIVDWSDAELRARIRKSMVAFERGIEQGVQLSIPEDQFLFPFVFSFAEGGQEQGQRFLTLLYRWASIVAKADRKISAAESTWLAKIMKLTGGGTARQSIPEGHVQTGLVISKPLQELDKMVGLVPVKEEVEKLSKLVRIQKAREEQGIKAVNVSYHCVFTGSPGTGKTTVARIVAGIYKDLGVLKKGHLVETDRAGLVAEYVGQTGPKTNKVIDSALDGVLFIDEAYALVEGGEKDYGKEAIATLLKRMEDDRSRLVVILAGYSENMKRFIESNPGLQSRFNRYIEFPDYGVEDLVSIFKRFAKTSQYCLGGGTEDTLRRVMEQAVAHKDKHFGNGRFARNIFEKAIERQAMRLASIGQLTKEMLQELLPEDIPEE